MKKITLLLLLLATSIGYSQTPEGTWKLTPAVASLSVGSSQGGTDWWSNSAEDITTRACLFDDEYVFNNDGSFTNVLGSDTWIEDWQGGSGSCATPVSPHDASNAATWVYNSSDNTITISGIGAYLGIPKPYNGGELASSGDAPASIIYTVTSINSSTMTLDIHIGGTGWWRFNFTKQVATGTDATLSDLQVDGTTIPGFNSGTESYTVATSTTMPVLSATTNDGSATITINQASGVPGSGTVVVTAADGTTTKTYTVSFVSSVPDSAAPTPPVRGVDDVISLFTQTTDESTSTYADISVSDFNPNWGSTSGNVTIDPYGGDRALTYPSFNYQGIVIGSNIDVSTMENIHIDVWTNSLSPNIYLISATTGEKSVNIPTNAGWSSIDIPLSSFISQGMSVNDIKELKFDGGDSSTTIYIDNIYFWKTPTVSGTDATLSDLQIDNATITGFSLGVENYTYGLAEGTTVLPQITTAATTDMNATTIITQASAIPGDATVVVTAENGTTTKTYTVSFAITKPNDGAPTPLARDTGDVISIYGDTYSNISSIDYNPNWGQSGLSFTDSAYDPGTGNLLLAYPNFNYQGIDLGGNNQDASSMEYLHVDVWTAADPGATTLQVTPVVSGSTPTEKLVTISFTSSTWTSIDIPLSDFTGMTLSNIIQLKFAANGAGSTVPVDIYLDNIYFWKPTVATWTGATDSNWNTVGNWDTGSVPTIANDVTIPNATTVVIGTTTGASVNDLTVDAGGSLTINSGGSLIANGTVSGNITYTLSVPDSGWHTISVPLADVTYDQAWMDSNSIDTGTVNSANRGIATYQNGTPDSSTGPWTYFTNASTGTFAQDKGYVFKRTEAGNYTFTGTYPSANVDAPITQGTDSHWNLIGNPYPSYLDVSKLLTSNDGNFSADFLAVYVWNGSSYSALPSGQYIHPGQSFFINSNVNNNASIAKALQTHTTGSFYRTNNPSITLTLSDGTSSRETKIDYLEGKTLGLDPGFDLGMFDGTSSNLRVFTHLVEDYQGVSFEIQALPNTGLESMIVPVGVKADANTEIIFSAEALQLPTDMKVFLEDRLTNTFTRLDEANTEYSVTLSEAVNGIGRFYIHTSTSALSLDDVTLSSVSIYKSNASTLRLVGLPQGNTTVRLFNIQGKEIMHTSFDANSVEDISLPRLSTGIYIVDVQTETSKLNKKIILE